ncbi:MAG: TIGR04283 family arsenosugar biosynthesis glycosyltransferase [Candidatus Aminicenantaceae bacterium]
MGFRRFIIFTRYPFPGRVKTRLIPALGSDGAASLHDAMTLHSLRWSKSLSSQYPDILEVRFEGGTLSQMQQWLGGNRKYVEQGEGDLGQRMERAFQENFQKKYRHIVLVGTDCPQMTAFHVKEAFFALKSHDMVIGPSEDGGYYLIGLSQIVPELFVSMEWGTDKVFKKTMEKAKQRNLSVRVLARLNDVDEPDDLPVWDMVSNQFISVVIPTLNEEVNLPKALQSVGRMPYCEVIVADGGSQDRTVPIAEEWGAKVVLSEACRGSQMNAGARKASGDILLFLHADTVLPEDYAELIRHTLSNPSVPGGSFAVRFSPTTGHLNLKSKTISWRTTVLRKPYGDQAIFVRASLFRLMGEYTDIPLMEDVDFVNRLRKRGKLAFIHEPVVTDSRRFRFQGGIKATFRNKLTKMGYALGVSPERLARFYYKSRIEQDRDDNV